MDQIPKALRETIAKNIRACRQAKFPGRGGQKTCAEQFGTSQQQWCPWETGIRTPKGNRLVEIAQFFDIPLEQLITEPEPPATPPQPDEILQPAISYEDMTFPESLAAMHRDKVKAVYTVEMVVSSVDYRPYD